jgi:hypothetical protein
LCYNGSRYINKFYIYGAYHREERRLRVFENRMLRRLFGPKRNEVTGEWRKLHNEEVNDLYSLPNIVWVVKTRRMIFSPTFFLALPMQLLSFAFIVAAKLSEVVRQLYHRKPKVGHKCDLYIEI